MQAKALWYVAPGRAELREEVLASSAGSLRIRALHGALSRGTESLVFHGKVPVSEHARMRAPHMGGAFPFPVKYGYSLVGRIDSGPMQGRTVFCLHPHQTVFDAATDAAIPVPANVPASRAILAANMETALNATWDAAPGPADHIAVVGAGVVGMLVAYLCGRLPGAQVTLIDIDPGRAAVASTLGVGFAAPKDAVGDCDLVFHASGSAAGLATAIALAGDEAKVIEMSWYGDTDVTVPLGGAFHSRRLSIIGSQVGKVAPSHRPRWPYARRLRAALDLLADERLDALIAPPIAFTDLPTQLPRILAPGSGVLCQRIDYPA
ncbi:MAG TPA: zinc-binding alcohol dehydrogenase [Xanthobacteraceae bacterium]|nr:zinc-binding alcohol dehydrogenase [Xanthobacteraceae bacterium]